MSKQIHIAREGLRLGTVSTEEAVMLLGTGFFLPTDEWWTDEDDQPRWLSQLEAIEMTDGTQWKARALGVVTGVSDVLQSGVSKVTGTLALATAKQRAAKDRATQLLLANYIPRVRELVDRQLAEGFAARARSALQDEEFLRKLFGAVYDCLPKPVYRFVDENAFISFCLEKRRELLGDPDKC